MPEWKLSSGKLKPAILFLFGVFAFFPNDRVLARNYPVEAIAFSDGTTNPNIPQTISSKLEKSSSQASSHLRSSPLLERQLAQVPNPVPPLPPEQPLPTPQPSPPTPLEIEPLPVTPPEARPEIPGTIAVKAFEFEGNTAISSERLSEITAQFTNRSITFAELLQVETVITQEYVKAGYINSGAVIPADQTFAVEGAVVKVKIIEGGIEEIQVTGTRQLDPNYVRSRVALGTGKPLNRERLLEALQILQLNPLIKDISAELSTGSRPELSLLEVKVTEAKPFHVGLFTDNARAPSVGSWRRGIRLSDDNLTGMGDRLAFEYTNTDGSNAFNGSYAVPLNARNGTLSLSGGFTTTSVIEPPFDRIDITGDSNYFEVSFRQPIVQTPTEELALGLTGSRQESQTELLGFKFPLSPGADDEGNTRITAVRFFQDYVRRSPQDVLALRSQFSLGIGALNATINDDPPDSRFLSWRGQGQYVRLLGRDTLLVVRSDLQLSTRALVPLEQFSVGGLQSVRGYRQDLLLTDNGFFTSAEVRLPILRVKEVAGVLQLVPFIDFGLGWNSSSNQDPDPNSLLGVGLGLQWQMGDNFNARFDWGIPLTDVESSDRTLQEQGFYFSVNYNLF